MRSRLLLAVAATVACSAALRAENPPPAKLVTKTYPVADLVIPIPDRVQCGGGRPTPAERATPVLSGQLIRLVTGTVRPSSWDARGGPGKIEFVADGYSLVVTNTPDAVAQVRELLEGLRRLQDTNVVFEVRVVTVAADATFGACPAEDGGVAFLTDAQLTAAMKAAQADRRAAVMQAPKVTTFDGQEAVVRLVEKQTFVTGVEARRVKGQVVLVPKSTPVETGTTLTLRGRVSADGRFVAVDAGYADTRVDATVEMIPVTTLVTPVFEGGSRGKPIPFTQFLQAPQVETVTVEKKGLNVPAGGHVVIAGPTHLRESREEFGPPVLSGIPYLNRMFKNVGYSKSAVRTYLVVSPRVVDAAEEAPMPRGR